MLARLISTFDPRARGSREQQLESDPHVTRRRRVAQLGDDDGLLGGGRARAHHVERRVRRALQRILNRCGARGFLASEPFGSRYAATTRWYASLSRSISAARSSRQRRAARPAPVSRSRSSSVLGSRLRQACDHGQQRRADAPGERRRRAAAWRGIPAIETPPGALERR